MSDQTKLDLLAAMSELSRRYPEWRFGQLVANVVGWADEDVWDIEDEQLLQAAQEHLKRVESMQHQRKPA